MPSMTRSQGDLHKILLFLSLCCVAGGGADIEENESRNTRLCSSDVMETLEQVYLDMNGGNWICGAPGKVCRQPPNPFEKGGSAGSGAERELGLSWSVGLSTGWRDSQGKVKPSVTDCCKWYGILCHEGSGHTRALLLQGNGINSTIPAFLKRLTALEHLDLSHNHLHGAIPPDIAEISTLKVLVLLNNSLTGPIPPTLSRAKQLERIVLTGNKLTGTIPGTLGEIHQLQMLLLNENKLSGTIPPELSGAARLTHLYLHNNLLEGTVPPSLFDHHDMSKDRIKHLYVNGNNQPHRISFHHSERQDHYTPRHRTFQREILNADVKDWQEEIETETDEQKRQRKRKANKVRADRAFGRNNRNRGGGEF